MINFPACRQALIGSCELKIGNYQRMIISGIQKFTVLDYPGKTACIIFTGGCDLRCRFCHNPEFVLPEGLAKLKGSFIPEEAVFNFLRERQGLLDGVVISGGEPTIMPDLDRFIGQVKDLGFLVKLDTNGNHPQVLLRLLESGLLDYVAMDFKTSLSGYQSLAGPMADAGRVAESMALLKAGRTEYEFRTTLIREFHTDEILDEMRRTLRGAKRLYLQPFRSEVTLDPALRSCHAFSRDEMERIAGRFREEVGEVGIREI